MEIEDIRVHEIQRICQLFVPYSGPVYEETQKVMGQVKSTNKLTNEHQVKRKLRNKRTDVIVKDGRVKK